MDEFANTIAPAASIGSNQLSKRCTTVSFWGCNELAFVVTLVSGVGLFSDAPTPDDSRLNNPETTPPLNSHQLRDGARST